MSLKSLLGLNTCEICGAEFKRKFAILWRGWSRYEVCPRCEAAALRQQSKNAMAGVGSGLRQQSGCSCTSVGVLLLLGIFAIAILDSRPRPSTDATKPASATPAQPRVAPTSPPSNTAVKKTQEVTVKVGDDQKSVFKSLGQPRKIGGNKGMTTYYFETCAVDVDNSTGKVVRVLTP